MKKKVNFIIDIDDYEGSHVKEFNDTVLACAKKEMRFKLNVFAIPGMMNAEQITGLVSNEFLIPCLHGFWHTQGESLNWTKDMALQALLWAEKTNFVKVFRAPYWAISDGTYEAIVERRWYVADHPTNKTRLLKLGFLKRGYFHDYDITKVSKLSEAEMWNLFNNVVKIHGGVKQLPDLIKFIDTLTNIDAIDCYFISIYSFMKNCFKYSGI